MKPYTGPWRGDGKDIRFVVDSNGKQGIQILSIENSIGFFIQDKVLEELRNDEWVYDSNHMTNRKKA